MGLLGGMARTAVVAGTATAVSNRVSRRQGNRWAQQDQAAYEQQQPVYAAPPPPPAPRLPPPTTCRPSSRSWRSCTPAACSATKSSPQARPRSSASRPDGGGRDATTTRSDQA